MGSQFFFLPTHFQKQVCWRTRLVRVRMVPSGAEKVGWGPSVICLLHSNGRTTVGHFDFQAIISQLFSDQLLCSELNLLYNLKLKTVLCQSAQCFELQNSTCAFFTCNNMLLSTLIASLIYRLPICSIDSQPVLSLANQLYRKPA